MGNLSPETLHFLFLDVEDYVSVKYLFLLLFFLNCKYSLKANTFTHYQNVMHYGNLHFRLTCSKLNRTPITNVCQKAWYIRVRPWKREYGHGSVQYRLIGVRLENASQKLSSLFAQLLLIKIIYQKFIKRAWVQLYTYIWLFVTVIWRNNKLQIKFC